MGPSPWARRVGSIVAAAALACAALLISAVAHAQEVPAAQDGPLTVGVYESPPFVMADGGDYSGMAIDLWEAMAEELDLSYTYRPFDTVGELVGATADGAIDVAVTNLTITEARAMRIDFTQPWFDAGLRLMVSTDQSAGFWGVVNGLYAGGYLTAYLWLVLVIIIATVGFTLFDRRFDKDFPGRWREGFAESFYTVMSVVTSGRSPSRKNLFGWVGRIWQALWLVTGIAVLAYVTSSVTSVMTTLALTGQINDIGDLPGRTVAVSAGSTAEDFVQPSFISSASFNGITDSAQALLNGRVDAVIGDTPVLEYFAHTHPELPVEVVGPIFQPDKYGFGLPLESELTRPLSVAVIRALESGLVEDLRQDYFGD